MDSKVKLEKRITAKGMPVEKIGSINGSDLYLAIEGTPDEQGIIFFVSGDIVTHQLNVMIGTNSHGESGLLYPVIQHVV